MQTLQWYPRHYMALNLSNFQGQRPIQSALELSEDYTAMPTEAQMKKELSKTTGRQSTDQWAGVPVYPNITVHCTTNPRIPFQHCTTNPRLPSQHCTRDLIIFITWKHCTILACPARNVLQIKPYIYSTLLQIPAYFYSTLLYQDCL